MSSRESSDERVRSDFLYQEDIVTSPGVRKLLAVLQGLVEKGNSVIVIEHNLDVIANADWVVDMGPEGGSGGGAVVATGTPEQLARNKASYTGHFLSEVLDRRRA